MFKIRRNNKWKS